MEPQILVVDFGSQYTRLIARRVREQHVYSEIVLPEELPAILQKASSTLRGIILSGSPESVHTPDAPRIPRNLSFSVPVLGICYGFQQMVHEEGGSVQPGTRREFGHAWIDRLEVPDDLLLKGIRLPWKVWMSHSDAITCLPSTFIPLAWTRDQNALAIARGTWRSAPAWGVQFHPEVIHTEQGEQLFRNFLFEICGCEPLWTPENFIQETITRIRQQIPPDEEVIMALSGGVDSTVAGRLIQQAVNSRFHGIIVDTGLLRKNEAQYVLQELRKLGMDVHLVDASSIFLERLKGVKDPEQKRKIIGETFIDVFFSEAQKRFPRARWLGQGTIYPDVIESAGTRHAHKIKSHHNVGGLPTEIPFRLIEPLRYLFKDEVREVGKALGIPNSLLFRHPFPGPGLAIRILGEVTPEKLEILRNADAIFIEELRRSGWYHKIWQAGVILLPVRSVGVKGDTRSYEFAICLRAVTSRDGMTADWARLPHELLARISSRIVNEVPGVNRVVYDLTSKPPGTIEWE